MENNTILNKFKSECQVINFVYEYPGYTGDIKYGISTNLTEKELIDKYGEILDDYSPYILLDKSYIQIANDYKRNENKHYMRAIRSFDISNYEDCEVECKHPELIRESTEDKYFQELRDKGINEAVYAALKTITEKQSVRIIKYYFQGMSFAKIAEDEGVDSKAIWYSIEGSLKKMKKFLEKYSINDLSQWE